MIICLDPASFMIGYSSAVLAKLARDQYVYDLMTAFREIPIS